VYPKALLFPGKESAIGQRFKSLDGNVTLSVLSVDNSSHDTPGNGVRRHDPDPDQRDAPDDRATAARTARLRHRHEERPRLSHMKMVLTDKFDRLLSIEYNESDRPVFDPVWTHIVTARAAGAIGVDAPSVQGSRVERSREGTRKLGPRRDKSRRLVTSSA
jgi:hypothetical protein